MAAAVARPPLATASDIERLSDTSRVEVIAGQIVEKASPGFEHGDAQAALATQLRPPFVRRGGVGGPGGWWLASEVEIEFETHEVYRPDLSGWRRDRVPNRELLLDRPVRIRPDWVCEILSPSNRQMDLVTKFRVYHRCAVPHYWVVDPTEGMLTVHKWTDAGYLVVLQAARSEVVRAEPFDAIELRLGALFGDDEES